MTYVCIVFSFEKMSNEIEYGKFVWDLQLFKKTDRDIQLGTYVSGLIEPYDWQVDEYQAHNLPIPSFSAFELSWFIQGFIYQKLGD